MPSSLAIIVVAGGRGFRAGEGLPKQYRKIAGRTVLARGLEALHRAAPDAALLVVLHPDDLALYEASVFELPAAAREKLLAPVHGGASRQTSARNGLEALAASAPDIVLIHDAARPFVGPALVARACAAAAEHGAGVPGLPLADTVKEIDAQGFVAATPARAALRAVQTPQAFRFPLILDAHRAAAGRDFTDDAMVAEAAGHKVIVFDGDPDNVKLTTPEDFVRAEQDVFAALPDMRVGQGFDVHAFADGDHVWLGGVAVPHTHSLKGHSDADVLMHAVTDAILGALAEGDIGAHFPPSEPRWKGAPSKIFLEFAASRVRARGGLIAFVDATVICEAPKVGPHREAIRESLARIMGVDIGRVAVKATTSERLGFTGRGEGIAALALATLRLPGG